MGVDSYGIYVLAYAWMNILLLPARQGFDIATVRFVSDYRSREEWGLLRAYLRFSRTFVLAASIAVAVGMALGAWLFRSHLGQEALWAFWLAAATLPVYAQVQLYDPAIRGLSFVLQPQFVHVLSPALLILVLLLAVTVLGIAPTADTGMAIYLGATAVCFAGLWFMARAKLPAAVRGAALVTERRDWLNASFAMMFLMSFGPILNQISIVILGAMDGNAAAGQYGAAVRISYLIQPFIVAQNIAIGPMVADLLANGNRAELQRITRVGTRLVFLAASASAAVVVVFGQWILGLLGEEFASAYPVLVVLIGGSLMFSAAGPASMLLNMSGNHDASAKILGLCAVVNLILLLGLIPHFGALGAAWAGVLARVIGCLFLFSQEWNLFRIDRYLAIWILLFIVVTLLVISMGGSRITGLVGVALAGLAVYQAITYWKFLGTIHLIGVES